MVLIDADSVIVLRILEKASFHFLPGKIFCVHDPPSGMAAFSARVSGLPAVEALRRAHEILDFCGIEQERYRQAETYSTGMRISCVSVVMSAMV